MLDIWRVRLSLHARKHARTHALPRGYLYRLYLLDNVGLPFF
jgi:hypothetical protein